ncbi:transposase [Kitasatospora sp. NPDC028055]|uniref:transposase n=1 Tax=Kitasatospora sp. NPDC028055 TaxID=3155653 RepID=UPI0033FB3B28
MLLNTETTECTDTLLIDAQDRLLDLLNPRPERTYTKNISIDDLYAIMMTVIAAGDITTQMPGTDSHVRDAFIEFGQRNVRSEWALTATPQFSYPPLAIAGALRPSAHILLADDPYQAAQEVLPSATWRDSTPPDISWFRTPSQAKALQSMSPQFSNLADGILDSNSHTNRANEIRLRNSYILWKKRADHPNQSSLPPSINLRKHTMGKTPRSADPLRKSLVSSLGLDDPVLWGVNRVPDDLWTRIEPLLPPIPAYKYPRTPDRKSLAAIIYALRTGVVWGKIPSDELACSGTTARKRLQEWTDAGVWRRLHDGLMTELNYTRQPHSNQAQEDGTHLDYSRLGPEFIELARCISCLQRIRQARSGNT